MSPAAAELVQHTYTGTVNTVTDGTGGTVDMTGTFSNGQSVTFVMTLERSTGGFKGEGGTLYLNAVTAFTFSIGSYNGTLGVANQSNNLVTDDYDANPGPAAAPAGTPADFYFWQIPSPNSAMVNGASPVDIEVNMMDAEATQFSNEQLPRVMPDMADFESTQWGMVFINGSSYGIVGGVLGGVSTPVNASTWGRIKAGYRN
ncbi:MAG: hypothetical protein ACREOU_04275 [Candidatus Eiseniibacteriota bacterium]